MERKMDNQYAQEYFNHVPNINQNDINDDDPPCPPPGLDRLVTGQTVSFDDGLNTPTFDRIVPGEGMSPSATARMPGPMYNKSFFNNVGPQDFLDSYQQNANVHDDSETTNHSLRTKYPHQMFPSPNIDRRETYLQQNLPHMPSPSNAFNQVDNKNTNPSFYNFQTQSPFNQSLARPIGNVQYGNSQSQRSATAAKADPSMTNFFVTPENDQNIGMKEKTNVTNNFAVETRKMEPRNDEIPANRMAIEGSCDDAYTKTAQLNQTFSNYGSDRRDTYAQQDLRRMPSAPFDQVDSTSKNMANASSNYQPLTNTESLPSNVQYAAQSHPVAVKSEMSNYSAVGNAQISGNKEKLIGAGREIDSKNDDLLPNRMAVEGSCGNVSFTRPVPSYAPNKPPNYELWYSNNSNNSFPDNSQDEDSRQTRDNLYGSGKSSTGTHLMQQQQLQASPNEAHFMNSNEAANLNVADVQTTHSKTPSSLSNASSTNNELSSYQHNDNYNADSKRDHSSGIDQLEGRNAPSAYDLRNSSVIDEETASYSDYEDRSIEMRTVIGYNNTLPRRKNEKLPGERKQNNSKNAYKERKPPLEQRMVVGETSSDAAPLSQRANRTRDDYEGGSRRSKNDRFAVERNEKHMKKHPYNDRKDRRKVESEEDYDDDDDDLDYKHYHDSRDRGDRYREIKMYEKGHRRKPVERGEMKETSYYRDSYPRSYAMSTSKYRKPVSNHRYDDSFSISSRNSRPSSRSQIKCPDMYEPLNPYRLVHENKLDERELRKCVEMWETDLPRYVLWFRNAFEKEYSIWYREYYEPRLKNTPSNVHQTARRGSGHSEHNSFMNSTFSDNEDRSMGVGVNNRSLFRPVEADATVLRESRYTPMKYQGAHTKGIFNSLGQLVVIRGQNAKYDGAAANIAIYQLSPPDDADWREFLKYPGPFITGETRPNTVCDLLTKRMDESRTSSEKLLYLLIKLIIRGVSDGTAVSEILKGSYEMEYGAAPLAPDDTEAKQITDSLSRRKIMDKYTNLLLQGSQDSALDWAVEHELWGHAIFLASKIVTSRYREVLAKFEASVCGNNPLKTLYQLYLDKIPQSASACRDEKWGDWRPHLAMILSNRIADNEQHKAAIVTLGDSLASKDIFAAHFCYVAADLVFDTPDTCSTKYSLLGLRGNGGQFDTNTPNKAILLTQMYEYAKRLQRKEFTISALLPYKYLLATRLLNYGKVEAALQYLESIAIDIADEPSGQFVELSYNILQLAERFANTTAKPHESSLSEKLWFKNLKQFVHERSKMPFGSPAPNDTANRESNFQSQPLLMVPPKQSTLVSPVEIRPPQSMPLMFATSNASQPSNSSSTLPLSGINQQWPGNTSFAPAPLMPTPSLPQAAVQPPAANEPSAADAQNDAQQQANAYGQEDYFNPWNPPQQPISISMHSSNNYFSDDAKPLSEEAKNSPKRGGQSSETQYGSATTTTTTTTSGKQTTGEDQTDDKKSNGSKGWFNGIVGKLRRTNVTVAKLPDDKEIRFKYDYDKQQWVDKDKKDGESDAIREPPPPKANFRNNYQSNDNEQPAGRSGEMLSGPQPMSLGSRTGPQSMPPGLQSLPSFGDQNKISAPPMSNPGNMYTLSRGRGMKANYVNVMAPQMTQNPMMKPFTDGNA